MNIVLFNYNFNFSSNFTEVNNDPGPIIDTNSQLVGFFFDNSGNYGMYYKVSNNIFTVIYNGYYYSRPSDLY